MMTRSRALHLVLILAAALLVPACGKDNDKSSGSTGGTPPPGGAPPPGATVPATPQNVVATPGDTLVTLTWDPSPGATGYTIRSATDQGGPYGLVEANFPGTMFIDDTLDNGTTYYWVITAVNAAGESPPAPEVSATPTGTAPPPTTTDWNQNVGNPVLSGTTWDSGGVFDPAVVRLGASSWVMYYTGASSTGTWSIGRATSTDGVTWTKTGTGPVLAPGAAGTWDSTWVGAPFVMFSGSTYRMWYTGSGTFTAIGTATSTDGITWVKGSDPVLVAGTAGAWDESGVSRPWVLLEGGTYRMWYAGSSSGVGQIGHATSPDGIVWTKTSTPVLSPTAGSFDARGISSLAVVRTATGYRGWYQGSDGPGSSVTSRIGTATSADGLTWTKEPASGVPMPVLDVGAAGSWNDSGVFRPFVIQEGSFLRMWFAGRNAASTLLSIGLATSGS